jgi:hypothetical protein
MSVDIVLALFAGVVVGAAVGAIVGGFCYLSGIAFGAQALWLGLIAGAFTTVATLRHLERSATRRAQERQPQ